MVAGLVKMSRHREHKKCFSSSRQIVEAMPEK